MEVEVELYVVYIGMGVDVDVGCMFYAEVECRCGVSVGWRRRQRCRSTRRLAIGVVLWCPDIHRATDPEIPKLQRHKNNKIQNSKNPHKI